MKKGIRQKRLCRFCGKQVKENWSTGKFKGYYRTCGEYNCRAGVGENNHFFGKTHTVESLARIPLFQKGQPTWNKGKVGIKNPYLAEYNRAHQGSKHWRWKGGITPWYLKIRLSKAYKDWRKAVYERDGYACVLCDTKGTGRNLNADHIKPFVSYPELRLDVKNGRTLCIDCHRKTDTYGGRTR